jgi:RimJ/RimL family protein N-acetyltransferase
MDYTIDLLKQEEIPAARTLMESCFPKSYHSIFFIHPDKTLVARSEGKIVGGMNMDIAILPNKKRVGYFGWLYTDDSCRGSGIASALTLASIEFLQKQRCTDIVSCVEGDNGSSMKVMANNGFSIMPLRRQMQRFGLGLVKVNRMADRFFDMGYFLWHMQLPETETPVESEQRSFLTTALLNILAWIPCLSGYNLLHLLFPSLMPNCLQDWMYQKYPLILLSLPLFALAVRTLSMEISAQVQHVDVQFIGWDTAWLLGFLCPLILGIPFPVPGNVYISGYHWHNSEMDGVLCKMARSEQLFLAFFCILFRGSIALRYCFTLLLLDSLFFFYPFTGFNASRVKKRGAAAFVTPVAQVIVTALLLFL